MRNFLPLLLALAVTHPHGVSAQDSTPDAPGTSTEDTQATDVPSAPPQASGPIAKVEKSSVRDPAELKAFKEIQQRFEARAVEFESDVKRFLAQRKAEELAKIADGYDPVVQRLEEKEKTQRELAAERLRYFLSRYPDVPEADNIRFRLAELYYEQAVEDWLDAQATFADREAEYDRLLQEAEAALEAGDPTLYENLGELEFPKKDLGPSIELYGQIISRNDPLPMAERWIHLDRAYYSLGFAYMDTEAKQNDFLKARMAFRELLERTGEEGDLADAAHMFLGKLLFENEKKFEAALNEYESVVKKGPDGPYYQDGMFQLAWTSYKLAGRDPEVYEPRALELFTNILDESERERLQGGKESDYAPDARLNLARTLADISDRTQYGDSPISPVDVARDYFLSIGERPWERDVFIALAEVLAGCIPVPDECDPGTQNGGKYEFDSAIAVYEYLQTEPRWVTEADNPIFQRKKIWLLPQKDDPDLDRDLPVEQKLLVERYGERIVDPYTGEETANPWWTANRNNPDALDNVRQFIESSLAQVAVGLMQEAQGEKDAAKYRMAASKFREYMDKFPIADNFFQNQWYLANALLKATPADAARPWGSYEEAYREFNSLVQSSDAHPYGDGSRFGVMTSLRNIIEAKGDIHGPFDARSNSADVEEVITTDFGMNVSVYTLPEDHKALIASMDMLVDYEFSEPLEEGLNDYRETFKENEWFLRYTPALILAKHNRFDEARVRLESILQVAESDIDVRCNVEEVSFSATLLADSYKQEGDLVQLAATAKRFAMMFQQCDLSGGKWDDVARGAEFRICQEMKDAGDRLGAAECYEEYFQTHECESRSMRDNDECKFAAYNAPNNFEIVGRAERANELFERYVDLYPRDELSLPLYYRIALNYESVFDLKKAIDYYGRLVANDPSRSGENTADALYNVAFLKIGMGDHRGAAQGFEKYEQVFRDREDAVEVLFKAGEQWELVSERDALRFYRNYLRRFGPGKEKSNASHVIQSLYKIAQIQKNNANLYARSMNELQATFDQYAAEGQTLSPTANNFVAEWAVKKLQDEYDVLTDKELTGDQDKDNAMLVKLDSEEIPAFEASVTQVVKNYKSFEHGTKAVYLVVSSKLFIAELIYKMDCPFDDDETCDIWWEIYEEQWRPIAEEFEDLARKGFEKLIAKGKDEKQHSPAIDLAYQTLNKLDPFNYPDVKMESRGEPGLKGLPKPRPVGLPSSTDDAAPPSPAPPPNESSGEPEVPTDTETPGTEAPAPTEEPASQPDPAPAEDSPWGAPQ